LKEFAMANVVITGSTRGIGLGMAREFRARGHNVVVSSRGKAAVDRAVAELAAAPGSGRVIGFACDVGDRASMQSLWDSSAASLGSIDIWINNAGLTGPKRDVSALADEDIAPVFAANLWGAIYGTQIPLAGMTRQGSGKIFNFEGFGSDGMTAPGLAIYGMTKRAVTYFTKSVNKEIKGSPVLLGTISPGIVITDLLDESRDEDPAKWEKTKRMYNILADRVETVVPFIVDRVLAADKPATAIRWLTTGKAARRFLLQPIVKRRVMPN
jgi:NAD(P)-dependent dehydrogenase (short-subunit alcohol dehydrogenase family)